MRLLRRKHMKAPDPAGPAAEALMSREAAEAELGRQQASAAAEHREVLAPLRRMRERNHIAEDFIDLIKRGYS
jgi:hypothetical protein